MSKQQRKRNSLVAPAWLELIVGVVLVYFFGKPLHDFVSGIVNALW